MNADGDRENEDKSDHLKNGEAADHTIVCGSKNEGDNQKSTVQCVSHHRRKGEELEHLYYSHTLLEVRARLRYSVHGSRNWSRHGEENGLGRYNRTLFCLAMDGRLAHMRELRTKRDSSRRSASTG
jgi:hypothetical protein